MSLDHNASLRQADPLVARLIDAELRRQQQGLELIASQLEIKAERITGKIKGKNCHGQEKVRRILEKHVISDYAEIYAYGDSRGDLPMMELASSKFYRPFRG
jgi:phosphoserine phosphatase